MSTEADTPETDTPEPGTSATGTPEPGTSAAGTPETGTPGTGTPETAGVIAPPPLIFLSALAAGFMLDRSVGSGSLPARVRIPVGVAALGAGASLMSSFVRAFARAHTPLDPYKASEAIVTDGAYRVTRNPAYLGMTLTYTGIAVLSNSPWALVPLPVAVAVIDRGVIAREERYLERRFGAPYVDYRRRVRRWI